MLDDVLAENLAVVFCGVALADKAPRVEAYYVGRGNKFWSVLFRTRLTPRQFRPEEYALLLALDIGLADLARPRVVSETPNPNGDVDVKSFRRKIVENRPAIVAFNGKEAAKRCLAVESVAYGRHPSTFEDAVVYVLPSTSSLAEDHWDQAPWDALAVDVRKIRNSR